MQTLLRRLTLLLLLAVMIFTVAAHYVTPTACCIPTPETRSCGCQQAGDPERAASPHPCLVCLMQAGTYAPAGPQVGAVAGVMWQAALWQAPGAASDPVQRLFHPPILSLAIA